MRRSPLQLVAFALLFQLSCTLLEPLPAATGGVLPEEPRDVTSVYGPTAVEWVQARFLAHQTGLAEFEVRAVAEAIVEEALANDLPRELVLAVIRTESGFHNFARSKVGALGLMQIMPATGKGIAEELSIAWNGPATLFEPLVNVKFGTRYLRELHDRYGIWDKALAAYNWGPGAIDRRLRRGHALPARYVEKVLAQLEVQSSEEL
jgi:soluble lytic murein transglycosylase-like protein